MESSSSTTARDKVYDFPQPIRDRESKWNHRQSLAWDTAFFTNPGVLDPEELFGSLRIGENEIDAEVNHKHSLKRLPCVSKMTPRPSFAWDNAFLSDPGVLDAEELSLVNNGFTTANTPLQKSTDSTTMITQGSRFSVSSIEFDLFHDLRASLHNSSPNVKQTVTREMKHKLPDSKKRTTGCRQKEQPLSLIPQPKMSYLSSSSSISKPMTPAQAKPDKRKVASELGKNKGKHKNHVFEEQSGSKSTIRSSYSGYKAKDLTSSSSGLRLPLPKMGFFDSENGEKENREPNAGEATTTNRRRRHKSKLNTTSPPETRSILGQRKTRK